VGNVSYKLALPDEMKIHPVFHVELLRQYKGPDFVPPPAYECDDGSLRWAVETILDERGQGSQRKLLVRWEGYGPDRDTWEPREVMLEDAPGAVRDFDQKFEQRRKTEPRMTRSRGHRKKRRA
jgi:hypothetical protein